MKVLAGIAALLLCFPALCGDADFFPEVPDLAKEVEPRSYDPDNLFEYINGDAFNYINLGFEEVTVQNYAAEGERALTVDIFRHRSDNTGFGIYSHERPAEAQALKIGAEGYHREGILNFFKGPYYVKLKGSVEESVMRSVAEKVAAALPGEARFPLTASAFPEEGMRANSLRFIAEGFMGHSFLNSAFVAEYEAGDDLLQVFIIEAADVQKMLQDYLALVEKKGGTYTLEEGIYRFKDPYHSSRGTMNVKKTGKFIFGLASDSREVADSYLKALDKNLGDSTGQ
jgi:hypothetical protein